MPVHAPHRPVVRWLVTGCALIACMVAIGGITRLTGSGLSITEWKPIMGALPPMNEGEWLEAFEKYKRIPEYTLRNQLMDLDGFKAIFFWEYLHRNWGRLMGLVFIVPFAIFLRQGRLKGWLLRRTLVILTGGGLVGALGWFMVMSGLADNPDVSHFRLAIHLCAAFAVFLLVLWTVLDLQVGRRAWRVDGSAAARWSRLLLVLVVLQVVYGAFTAGLDAGRIYTTWPLMNGAFMPENVHAFGDLVKDLTDHRDGVQFVHRNVAWLVAVGCIALAILLRADPRVRRIGPWLMAAVLLQFVLGVATLLTAVQIALGVLHQLGALLLLGVLLRLIHATGRVVPPEAADEVPHVRPHAVGHRGQ
ncbi:MAG TPA: COX15/CtaA family protein [Flavobacteriales bacterium]|nr:COX15/CtaA family protein [Flavobacteriales bacterium]HMR26262.1 COX15/CtaA family protein [Flavobacteriales bacterium]